jgi:hypothetical protein
MTATRLFAALSAFGCGAILALAVLLSDQDLGAASATIHTCAAADGTLHVTESNVPCEPEQRRVRLQLPEPPDPECKADDGRVEKLDGRLKDLESRARQGRLRGRRVMAPFEVVTKKGTPVMRIEEENVTFHNYEGKPVVWIQTARSGAFLQTRTADGNSDATLAAQLKRSHLLIREKGNDRIDLGRRENGRYSIQMYGPQNKQVAGLGQSAAGSGILQIADAAGNTKASMYIDKIDTGPRIDVYNSAASSPVAILSASGSAGKLQIADAAGTTMVHAGLTDGGVGVVRAFPGNCHFGVSILGLVPDCIVGKRK